MHACMCMYMCVYMRGAIGWRYPPARPHSPTHAHTFTVLAPHLHAHIRTVARARAFACACLFNSCILTPVPDRVCSSPLSSVLRNFGESSIRGMNFLCAVSLPPTPSHGHGHGHVHTHAAFIRLPAWHSAAHQHPHVPSTHVQPSPHVQIKRTSRSTCLMTIGARYAYCTQSPGCARSTAFLRTCAISSSISTELFRIKGMLLDAELHSNITGSES